MNNDTYTGLLYIIRQQIGWEPFKQTFRDYATKYFDPSIIATDEGKVSLFVNLLSINAGEDLSGQFIEWGFPGAVYLSREGNSQVFGGGRR